MFKSSFLYLCIIFFLILGLKINTFWFFGGYNDIQKPIWLNLYKDISNYVKTLDEYHIEDWITKSQESSIIDELNIEIQRYNKLNWGELNCSFDKDLNIQEIVNIINWIDSEAVLLEKLDCRDIDISERTIYVSILRNFYNYWSLVANNKTENIININNIWRYSNWDKNDSSFDLITDLEDINKIIFREEILYPYWDNIIDLSWSDWNWGLTMINNIPDNITSPNLETSNDEDLTNQEKNMLENMWSNEICADTSDVLSFLDDWASIWDDENQNENENEDDENSFLVDEEDLMDEFLAWKFTDNNWCQDNDSWDWFYFNICIEVEFLNYSSWAWWVASVLFKSIEWFVDKSLEHLWEFVNKSLIQSEMSQNNFEIWLKNVDFPSLFNMWVHVIKKPVPLKQTRMHTQNQEKDDFHIDNLLINSFKDLWLDYNKINSLEELEKNKEVAFMINNSTELQVHVVNDRVKEINTVPSYLFLNNIKNSTIDSKITKEIHSDFLDQFSELEKFTNTMSYYSNDLRQIILWMNQINRK